MRAAEEKKAVDIKVLDLRPVTSFADYFIICTGNNQRQVQAICDEVERSMRERGDRAISVEGYDNGEWVLMDYGDMLVHIFSPQSRSYYELDRLWRDAIDVQIPAATKA